MKKYFASVYYQGEVDVTVSAKNKREAKKKITARITNRKVKRKDVRFDFFDIEEY